jgi:hypothetical protein
MEKNECARRRHFTGNAADNPETILMKILCQRSINLHNNKLSE